MLRDASNSRAAEDRTLLRLAHVGDGDIVVEDDMRWSLLCGPYSIGFRDSGLDGGGRIS